MTGCGCYRGERRVNYRRGDLYNQTYPRGYGPENSPFVRPSNFGSFTSGPLAQPLSPFNYVGNYPAFPAEGAFYAGRDMFGLY